MTKSLSPLEETKGRYACLLFDSTMKTVLGTVSNEDLFIGMLELLIPGKHIASIEMLNKEYHGLAQSEKRVIFDLLCKDKDTGEEFLVEVQNAPEKSYRDRMLYYSYFPIREQMVSKIRRFLEDPTLKKKMDYSVKPVYVVSILNFDFRHESDEALEDGYISRYGLRNDRNGEVLTQALNFVFLELDRLKLAKDEYDKCRSRLERFVFSFKYMHTFEEFPSIFMEDPMLRRLSQAAELANLPLEKMQQYEADMRTEIDKWAELAYAEEKGLAEGRAEGRAEGLAETARAMLADGMDPVLVTKYTGLSAEELEALK